MKLKLGKRNMDVANFSIQVYAHSGAGRNRGNFKINECFLTLEKTQKNNEQSWIKEWAALAEKLEQAAERSMKIGQTLSARQEYLRASALLSGGHVFVIPGG